MNISSPTSAPVLGKAQPSAPPPEQVASLSISPRQTEALLPSELKLVGGGDVKQEVSNSVQQDDSRLEDIRKLAEKANEYLLYSNTHLQFEVGENTGRIVVNVVDNSTKQIVRQIPPESLQRFASRITEMRGLLFDAKG